MKKIMRAALLLGVLIGIGYFGYGLLKQKPDLPAVVATSSDGSISVHAPYLRTNGPKARAGAGFLIVSNAGDQPDRLLGATSDIAMMIETHTHIDAGDGVMQMRPAEGGFEIPAGAQLVLERGGKHLMMMQMPMPLKSGESYDVTLLFEKAGALTVSFPVE